MWDKYINIIPWEYAYQAPWWFVLFLLIPLYWWVKTRWKKRSAPDFKLSHDISVLEELSAHDAKWKVWALEAVDGLVVVLVILALAKPYRWQADYQPERSEKYGIEIVLALDISVSMLARDFEPNRLEASKRVAQEFIDSRKGDRMALVVYEGEAYTACPSTLDYGILKKQLQALQPGNLEPGTAIGTGLGTAVNRLKSDSTAAKVIILLTDGVSNRGTLTPIDAALLAKHKGIRVYTIGVGTLGMAPSPVFTPFGLRYENLPVEIDEETLTQIAALTGGEYFRATDEEALRKIYAQIDKLEKKRFVEKHGKLVAPSTPLPFILWAIVLLLFNVALKAYYRYTR